jgi:uncharacterized protein (UPF0335 family)
MTKPLKFDDGKIKTNDAPVKIPNTADVKSLIGRIHKVMESMDESKADLKSLYAEADAGGIDTRAIKVVVKHKKRPTSVEHRQEVNMLLEKTGDAPMFAFV